MTIITNRDVEYSNAKGDRKERRQDRKDGGGNKDLNKTIGQIGSVAGGVIGQIGLLGKAFKRDKSNNNTNAQTNQVQQPIKKDNTTLYVIAGVVGLAIIGITIYSIKKK